MHLLIRRSIHRGNARILFFAVQFVGLFLFSQPSFAQQPVQIFPNSIWVSGARSDCVGPDSKGRFYCPGPGNSGGVPTGSCPTDPVAGCGGTCPEDNISNNPRIEFDQTVPADCSTANPFGNYNPQTESVPNIPIGSTYRNYCNSRVFLCMNIGFTNPNSTSVGIDLVQFEIFKFGNGTNPLDPTSAPPLKTMSLDSPDSIPGCSANCSLIANTSGVIPTPATCNSAGLQPLTCGYCVLWDGSINMLGDIGKSNGTYGYRVIVRTNQTGPSGNINVDQTRAYPSDATLDATSSGLNGCGVPACTPAATQPWCGSGVVQQQPITVDVTNIHVVRTTPTVVGTITGVAAEPYNITYRLSRDALMNLAISSTTPGPGSSLVRTILNNLPRVGEGIPDGTIQNGDAWDGRAVNGDLSPPGNYVATLQANTRGPYGLDLSAQTTRQLAIDPLQITDILVQPLLGLSTSLATLTYTLTEPATVYVDIYPPGTQFCNGLIGLNPPVGSAPGTPPTVPDQIDTAQTPSKNFGPTLGPCSGLAPFPQAIPPIRRIIQQQTFRSPVVAVWDGRDANGSMLADGDYVFVIYAALPSQNGFPFNGNTNDTRIWTSNAKSGFLSILRGLVGVSQITPATTVIGSSPSVAGLAPFIFTYSMSRDAIVTVKVFDASGLNLIKTLVTGEVRPGGFLNREIWPDGIGDNGQFVSSGTYLVQLTAADQFFPGKVSTVTATFPLDLFRFADLSVTPLLTGATDVATLGYQLSYGMNIAWNIYPPGTQILNSSATWPPCGSLSPGVCPQTLGAGGRPSAPIITVSGMRPGRLRITEFWDGRDTNGIFVPDGTYIFTLVAQTTTTPQYFATDRIIGTITIARGSVVFPTFTVRPTVPALFNSSQTITLPPFAIEYSVTRQSSVTIQILNTKVPPAVVRSLISGQIRDANVPNQDFWDARDDRGNFVAAGFYTVQITASDIASQLSSGSTVQTTVGVDPLRVYDVAVSPLQGNSGPATISYQVSETMKVAVKIYKPGTNFDPAGNPIPPESLSLVKRIVGVRPARSLVEEPWDGRDEKISIVQDGSYIFKIVASTDTNAIDSNSGAVGPGASLAEDLVVADIPIVRGQSLNPQGDFEGNTFMYPNPVNGPSTRFNIFVPFESNVTLKIFNIAGELVYQQDFADQPRSTDSGPIVFDWFKTNSSNRTVAPGVYFVLVREVEVRGGGNVLQTVKKMLLQ